MKFFLPLLIALLCSRYAFGQETGHLKLGKNHSVYYQVSPALGEKKSTILLFNGYIYALDHWNNYRQNLSRMGYEVIQYSYSPHPESLSGLKDKAYFTQGWPTEVGVSLESMATEAEMVLRHLEVTGRVDIASLSMGSLISSQFAISYPERVRHMIYFAPAVQASNFYETNLNITGWNAYFKMGEMNFFIDGQYQLWLKNVIDMKMKFIYPSYPLPEGVDFRAFANGSYHLARAVRYSDLKELIAKLPLDISVSMVLAEHEDERLFKDQTRAWNNIQKRGFTKSHIVFAKAAHHGVTGAHPSLAADITENILQSKYTEVDKTKVGFIKETVTTVYCRKLFSH